MRLLREPLFHFLLIGAAVFALYALVGGDGEDPSRETIVVSEGRMRQLALAFAKTWQRPPSPQELRGLIDAYIKEEVYYREAVKLGLDRDDTLIRRRMQQKMEFLAEPGDEDLAADDAALQAFLDDNKGSYRVEPRLAFEQVYFASKPDPAEAKRRAEDALAVLKAGKTPQGLGDPTLLPVAKTLSPLRDIGRDFGDGFAMALIDLPPGAWTGPIESAFGLHLVRVSAREEAYDPDLGEVREEVLRDWRTQQRQTYESEAYERLRAKYDVLLPDLQSRPAQAEAAQ